MIQTIFKGNKKYRRLKNQSLFENDPKLVFKAHNCVHWGESGEQVLMNANKN